MTDEDPTLKTGLATTGGGAMSTTKTLAEQQAEIDAARDADVARREAWDGSSHAGDVNPASRTNPTALALVPKKVELAESMRLAFIAKTPSQGDETAMRYHCVACGWNNTLRFDPADPADAVILEAGLANYGGPCPGKDCGYQTLVPHDGLGHHETFNEIAAAQKAQEIGIVTDVVMDKIEGRIGNILLGPAADAVREAGEGHPDDVRDPGAPQDPKGELPPG
ncbi:MAG TPA: hypothetical protein VIY27_02110 [Myxococcota bacterium]